MTLAPEFSRPERADQIGPAARDVAIEADAAERRALAARFDLPAIERLAATFSLRREAGAILLTGRVTGEVTQACTVTAEPLTVTIDEPVALRAAAEDVTGEEERELSADALDTVAIEDGSIDLGEIAAETLALALDPFPRAPDAAAVLRAAGVIDEETAAATGGRFGALAALRDKLGG